MKTLILGGVRSGKSRLAERLASESGMPVTYIATATAEDAEMQLRIEKHRAHRPDNWLVYEEPIKLASTLIEHCSTTQCVIVDCLTLWLSNCLMSEDKAVYPRERSALLETLSNWQGEIYVISNETNMGVIPMGELSRIYCDEVGQLHQTIAQCFDRVILTIAGLPQILKGEDV